jgi:hypothetical protein
MYKNVEKVMNFGEIRLNFTFFFVISVCFLVINLTVETCSVCILFEVLSAVVMKTSILWCIK